MKICFKVGRKTSGSGPPNNMTCSVKLRLNSVEGLCDCCCWVGAGVAANPAAVYESLMEDEMDISKGSIKRNGTVEVEVRVAIVVYDVRRGWLGTLPATALRAVKSRCVSRLHIAVRNPRETDDKRRWSATLLDF